MRITDYETTRTLTDVGLVLTRDEAEELYIYLHKMLDRGELRKAFITEMDDFGINRELTIALEPKSGAVVQLSA